MYIKKWVSQPLLDTHFKYYLASIVVALQLQ